MDENKNMIKCKVCGKDIAKGVKKCVHCGKDQRNFFMKHKFISVILCFLILGGIGAALGEKPEKVGEATPASASASSSDNTNNETETFKVGDVIKLNDFKFTVNKVYSLKAKDFFQPKKGNVFLAIDCTVENISDEEKAVSSIMMFKVVDKDGRQCEYSMVGQSAANAGQLDGSIGAGRKMTGVYVIEVAKGQKGLELEFDSSLLTGGQIVVKLN